MYKKLIYLLFPLTLISTVNSQELINENANYIDNKTAIQSFYDKLQYGQTVNILHIGDSHIQANFFTGKLRELFQNKYGKASRGIVFPLRLAKTNGHLDVKFYSNINWKFNKITDKDKSNVGIAAASIQTTSPNFFIKLKNNDSLDISRIKIIGKGLEKLKFGIANKPIKAPKINYSSQIYRVKKGDFLGKIARKFKTSVKKLKIWNGLRNDRLSINQKLRINKGGTVSKTSALNFSDFNLIEPVMKSDEEVIVDIISDFKELYIIAQENTKKSFTKIDGVFLENYNTGLVYNSIGMNSARFADYKKTDLFFKQLFHINPDLIIVSLGTNTAFYKNYNEETFKQDVIQFFEKLKASTTCENILITTPPSSLIRRKHHNPQLNTFTNILTNIAHENNFAVWNLFEIMGKEDGVNNWFKEGFVGKDKIHYTENGYFLQAEALFKSLFSDF